MDYYFKPSAIRDLKRLAKSIQRAILNKLDFYSRKGDPMSFAKALKDRTLGSFRFRIGDYRVIFDIDSKRNRIIILAVGHRKDIYR